MYLVCGLDSENYADASYDFVNTIEEARNAAIEDIRSWFGDDDDFKIFLSENATRFDGCDKCGNSFYVTKIFEVPEADEYCVWHHAYDGVDFKIVAYGKNAFEQMMDDARKYYSDNELGDCSGCIVVDNGVEWDVWEIVRR